MKRINLNKLAREITLEEGKKRQINIAQVKEVLKIFLIKMASDYTPSEIMEMIERYW